MTNRATYGMIFFLATLGGVAVHGSGDIFGVSRESFSMGEEAQKIGQVLKEFTRRMIVVLKEESEINDAEAYARYKKIISEGLHAVSDMNPFEPGTMQKARDTIERILLQQQPRSAFEDYDLFSSYMKAVGDGISDIGQMLIDNGIALCGNFVIHDGLSEFEKKNFRHCADVFRLSSMKKWKE